ncbi:MAG: DUF4350 domain-containing protein [Arthrobacter sp.]|uniref:DUF4350 domain-containing protein n=1 Tax=unclassified Arthrobacter TaxID=235627 RepID=UPI0026508BAF|nr:hypothetical protein [Micrococcaceae bacterium]MDN5905306.1 hypothetical protein [Micrococcaceae bacterium]
MSRIKDGDRLLAAPRPASARSVWAGRWRAWRLWIIIAVVAVLAAVYYALANGPHDTRVLSPQNPGPEGGKAVARVLADHDISVEQPDGLDAALAALRADGGTTLLLHDQGGYLNQDQLTELDEAAGRTVLVEPGFDELRVFAPSTRPAGVVPEEADSPVAADCPVPAVAETREAAAGGKKYRAARGCFNYGARDHEAYGYVVEGTTTVLGNPAYLDNGHVLDFDHAPLALRTLGAEPTLVWYQPTVADHEFTGPAANPFELLPDWVSPASGWLLLLGVIAILWRARRDGPLVSEPLPVVVPASETAEGRARLYRDAQAIDAAVAALRSASLDRLAVRLRLGHGSRADDIVATAAKESGLPGSRLRRLYFPEKITGEAGLVEWAQELHTVEKEIGIP